MKTIYKNVLICLTGIFLIGCENPAKVMKMDFADVINEALARGEKTINVPKGIYYMALKDGQPLELNGLKDVVINGNGSQIITKKASLAIEINHCENVKLTGFSIDCETLPFTQGTIIAMDTIQRMWWDVEIMEGYPVADPLKQKPDRIQIFDPKTQTLKKNLYTYWRTDFASVELKKGRVFRFKKNKYNPDSNEELGDYVVMSLDSGPETRPHSIFSYKSKNIQMEDITIYSGNCFGFFEDQCESNSYDNCTITKKTDDSKVSFPRLRSINADAFHSKGAIVGPSVTNCTFMYHGDDCIAINTTFYKVISTSGSTVDIVSHLENLKMRLGDNLRFINFDGSVAGEAKVLKIEKANDFSKLALEEVNEMYSFTVDKRKQVEITRLTLDKTVEVGTGGVVSSLDMGGSGFVVKNNILGYTRARGILIKAPNGVISGNKVIGCELGGIILAPELFWMEAGFAQNVTVENNVIKDCMFANSSYGIEQAAAISVVAINAKDEVAPSGGFTNITIKNNTILNSPVPAIILTSIDGGVVENNSIGISRDIIRQHGKILKIDEEGPIWIKNNKNLQIKNNTVDK